MALLIVAALLWIGVHVGIAGTAVRGALAGRLGEGGFRAAYSVVSIAAIWFLIEGWKGAATTPLWFAPGWLRWLLVALMLPAFVLFVASVASPNPTAVGGETRAPAEPRGIQRVTRHPMLWSFSIWAAVHIIGNGDSASLVFFGAFLITALAGMPSIDAKLAARNPAAWDALAPTTSILPGAAILAGRNHLSVREIGWLPPVLGGLAWAALLHFHRGIFGVSPFG